MLDNKSKKGMKMGQQGNSKTLSGVILVLIGGGLLSLSGCSSSDPALEVETNWIDLQWSETMKGMGYVPVFPPKEDMRVGDLLLCPFVPPTQDSQKHARPRYLVSASRWSSLEVTNLLDQEYQNRPSWPSTPETYFHVNADPEARTWEEPRVAGDQSIFGITRTPYRLRSVAAGIISASNNEYGNNILIPTEAINVAMGTAWSDQKSVSLRAGNAEEYSLSMQKLLPMALEKREVGEERRTYLKDEHLESLSLAHTAGPNSVYLSLVNEVMYLRSLDITVQSQDKPEATEEVKPANLMVSMQTTEVAAPAPNQPVDPNATPAPTIASEPVSPTPAKTEVEFSGSAEAIDPALAAFIRAQALNKTLMKGDGDDQPDEFTRFISVTDSSVSLRKTWRYGLAIGIKGMQLQVNKYTGEVVASEPMIMFFK
ncbi:hypothetical protein ACFL6U_28670 [Planctomycetota bacterium]